MGVSPKDGLALMWHIPAKLSSAQSRRAVAKYACNIHDCFKPRRSFFQLSFLYILFSFNIFLITHFRVVLSFQSPFDHNTITVFSYLPVSSYLSIYNLLSFSVKIFKNSFLCHQCIPSYFDAYRTSNSPSISKITEVIVSCVFQNTNIIIVFFNIFVSLMGDKQFSL